MENNHLTKIATQVTQAILELLDQTSLKVGDIVVLGCSSSEVLGQHIGKHSSLEIGQTIIRSLLDVLQPKGIFLAVQGCEHLNRALVVERSCACKYNLEIVSVYPSLHAGGAAQVAAFEQFKDPVEVEHIVAHAGMDIGDTAIGMHVKFVQIPIRTSIKEIGQAHVTFLGSRPKLIGGPRAKYSWNPYQ
jgi:uncharacterized protein (TIGR01440 family)